MSMTPAAKRHLSTTIRALRARLLDDLHDATESAYRLTIKDASKAGLQEGALTRRKRLEDWCEEQVRMQPDAVKGEKGKGKKKQRTSEDFRREAEKIAAYTLLNRLVFLRMMEASGLRQPALIAGGWEAGAYKAFRELAPALVHGDASEGYAFLLQLVFDDLAVELPGLFGPAGVADLVPVPPATLRAVIEALNDSALETCWNDDMTPGWVYQYWNDPEREELDKKINEGGKIEPHEIASKTQLFTERYMVDWLLQNSLGPMWLAMCQKHGWTSHADSSGTLSALETRRVEWRKKRESGEVDLVDLMPLHTDLERRWAYYVPQPITKEAVAHANESIRDVKLIDPAVGSGHFLVVAFELFVALYEEEARHRNLTDDPAWSRQAIVESIIENNLHGIDIDPRAVQIAAAALWLKARQACPTAQPRTMNLVASNLQLAGLPDDDPALVELRQVLEADTGLPAELTNRIVHALHGADHLGSLLKVDAALDSAIKAHEQTMYRRTYEKVDSRTVLAALESFLARHSSSQDLGLRLRGEQLAAGVRFIRLIREGSYDVVVANPPYQGTSKMAETTYIQKHYPKGKADLYAAFLERGLQLVRERGTSAMLTMRGWMFIKQYSALRQHLLETYDLRALGDLDRGAFEEIAAGPGGVSVAISIFQKTQGTLTSIALRPSPIGSVDHDLHPKRAAVLAQVGRYEFEPLSLKVVPEWPLVYWWDADMLRLYRSAPSIGDVSPACAAQSTGDNTQFVRYCWEVSQVESNSRQFAQVDWKLFVNGAEGREWCEPAREVVNWACNGLPIKSSKCHKTNAVTCSLASEEYFLNERGVAFSMIGADFSARVHRYPSVFGNKGSSIFPADLAGAVCAMNSTRAREILESLNPGIGFEVGDVNRLPLFPIESADEIFAIIEEAFGEHEAHREPSVEFKFPGPSPWRYAQEWAQVAVDRAAGAPLPVYEAEYDAEPATDHLSFMLGIALGRFGMDGYGILDPERDDLTNALPGGILFLDGMLGDQDDRDSLGHEAARGLREAWEVWGESIDARQGLRGYLRNKFFEDVHRKMYESRPIHWPLSSAKKTFVAWVNIHRMNDNTLRVLLADHLYPALARLDGELADLREARDASDKKAANAAERRYVQVQNAHEELTEFIASVSQCAEKGAPPTDAKCPPREVDARYAPVLDDGVMINSAALWPLLDPQWKDPKKWFKELSTAKPGAKDYDWSQLAARYWPSRVDGKCRKDPSLAVAHGCFWRYHPARAWAWELRLQDEIGGEFKIDEEDSDACRAAYLSENGLEALATVEKEVIRRMGRGKDKKIVPEMRLLEAGLWTAHPEACWALEGRMIERQEGAFVLDAPDGDVERARYGEGNPERVAERRQVLGDEESDGMNEIRTDVEQFRELVFALFFSLSSQDKLVNRTQTDIDKVNNLLLIGRGIGLIENNALSLTKAGQQFARGFVKQTAMYERLVLNFSFENKVDQRLRRLLKNLQNAVWLGVHKDVFWSEIQQQRFNEESMLANMMIAARDSKRFDLEDFGFEDVPGIGSELIIPDAHQVKILERLVEGIALGTTDKKQLGWYIDVITVRTVDRYIRLARQVGLVTMEGIGLTNDGDRYVFSGNMRRGYLKNAFENWDVVQAILAELSLGGGDPLYAARKVILDRTRLTGESVKKRARGLVGWLNELDLIQLGLPNV